MEVRDKYDKISLTAYLVDCLNKAGPDPGQMDGEYFRSSWSGIRYRYRTYENSNFILRLLKAPHWESIGICSHVGTKKDGSKYIIVYPKEIDEKFSQSDELIEIISKLVAHYNDYYDEDIYVEVYRGRDEIGCPPTI